MRGLQFGIGVWAAEMHSLPKGPASRNIVGRDLDFGGFSPELTTPSRTIDGRVKRQLAERRRAV